MRSSLKRAYSASLVLACVIASGSAWSQTEAHYRDLWCDAHNGQAEVTLPDRTRADCVTDTHAVEVERARKWQEALGQALWYSFQLNKRAGVVLIVGPGDERLLLRLRSVIDHYALPVDVWTLSE